MLTINIDPVLVHLGPFAISWYGLVVGIIMVTGIGGEHGPGRHAPGANTWPSSQQENTGSIGSRGRGHDQAGMRSQITMSFTLLPAEAQQL